MGGTGSTATLLEADTRIKGVSGTFRDVDPRFLQDWYGYMEGFAAGFVTSLRQAYLATATAILDPFGGTGTTPLECGVAGALGTYCEANPLLADLTEAKARAMSLDSSARAKLVAMMKQEAARIRAQGFPSSADEQLHRTYAATFGDSAYFADKTLAEIRKARSHVDELTARNELLGCLVEVACYARLVECSLVIRSGDVRFRKGRELDRVIASFADAVADRLRTMADGLARAPTLQVMPRKLAKDARALVNARHDVVMDGLITSPPYLNGTNYIRNTKLELWFARHLVDGTGLRSLRDTQVTSGINDVAWRPGIAAGDEYSQVLSRLEKAAYDRRIPQMVTSYFEDMRRVLVGSRAHLRPGAPTLIDIGDSLYAGVHVPTHEVLEAIAQSCGFEVHERQTVRRRRSKGGEPLGQYLLVLEAR